ncbi:hypothetical protein [Streptomyces sp. NPDC059593]|uniref:hypothetical protein n=1 Tax=Streptomyces sp. NPDC059593 TaxID=3346878 RepID=UPI00368DA1AD
MKKSLTVAAATCAALLLGSTAASAEAPVVPPAAAQKATAPQAAAAAAGCYLKVYTPWKKNVSPTGVSDHARGKYHTVNNCSAWYNTALLQYHRWDGWNRIAGTEWVGNRGTSYLQAC